MLSEEEASEIKRKIISHIESTFPEEQKSLAIQQVESMNPEQLENFLKRNKMIKEEDSDTNPNDCVFCSIASGKINSVKIDEDKETIAVLEINPISRGHTIVVPKTHSNKIPKEAVSLAKKISKKIKKKLSPKDVEISKSSLFGHQIINLVPIYSNENANSKRSPAKIEELEKIKEELEKENKKEKIRKKPKTEEAKQFFWLPKRIP